VSLHRLEGVRSMIAHISDRMKSSGHDASPLGLVQLRSSQQCATDVTVGQHPFHATARVGEERDLVPSMLDSC
jgi:hypothetical protein